MEMQGQQAGRKVLGAGMKSGGIKTLLVKGKFTNAGLKTAATTTGEKQNARLAEAAATQDGGTTSGWPPEGARYNCDERIVARIRLCVRESLQSGRSGWGRGGVRLRA